jgi:hypothetical protein
MTFFRGNRDDYVMDVDLTARLQAEAANREVVIDRRFYKRVKRASENIRSV